MRNLIFVLFLSYLFSFPVYNQGKNIVPVIVTNNRTYVTIKIGTHIIPNILLDTGYANDGLMIFNPAYRDSLELNNATEVQIGGAGSGQNSNALMIDSTTFSLGDSEMVNQPLIILQDKAGFFANGLIGYSIFGHFITEFDYDNNTMSLYNPDLMEIDSTWTTIPIYFKDNNIPWLDGSVIIHKEEPITLSMYIDYGAGDEIVLLEKTDMKFTMPEETKNILIGKGLSGDIYGKTGIISKLIIGPYELLNIKASFADAEIRSRQDNADAILGNASLRRFNIIFDYFNRKLYLKPNSHFSDASY